MFSYVDPADRNFLNDNDVRDQFRADLHFEYNKLARRRNCAFAPLEAFAQLENGAVPVPLQVPWNAFPLLAQASDAQIDQNRFSLQDEYAEWLTEKNGASVTKVTFTTEFSPYFEAYAAIGVEALKAAVADCIPGANPTTEELFGPGGDPNLQNGETRAFRFRRHRLANPWNSGTKGILCLTQPQNTRGALFGLLGACGIRQNQGTPADTCSLVGGACGDGRASDPVICQTAQGAVRGGTAFSLADPAGIRIQKLQGVWKLNGAVIDINAPETNQGIWEVSRNGLRGTLTVPNGLELDSEPITSGAQVARKLTVAADLLTAQDSDLPVWARLGNESQLRGNV